MKNVTPYPGAVLEIIQRNRKIASPLYPLSEYVEGVGGEAIFQF